ncbi:MAG: RNA polymerase sigma-54 factor [Sphingobacteriales bacterium 50-39]|nr:RNA polymerase factor sigma-54 [Sphingobacteriales bacterium]OJW61190.1 MAG: RNA polymerase sigma-54 factor [Sphingobacteriales bacterium 50-39]
MLKQLQTQKQQHTILPQQIELLNLFHLNTLELEQRIQDELTENPVLEESGSGDESASDKFSKDTVQDFQNWEEYGYDDIPDYKTEYKNYLSTENVPEKPIAEAPDFREELKRQCRFLAVPEEKYFLFDFLIDSLNENGFLEQDLEELASEISFSRKTWIEAPELEDSLKYIRELEPFGAGCRHVQEYMLLQLKKMNTKQPDVRMAICILEDHFQDLRGANLDRLKKILGLDDEEIRIVLGLLAHLKTRPFSQTTATIQANPSILPDFILLDEGEKLEVALYRQRSSSLHISQSWMEMVHNASQNDKVEKSARQYLRSKLSSAQWFINAIQQRESNMLKIMRAILDMQYEYFKYGDILLLKPMKLKDIADKVKVDISTVSRLTCNKYIETPFGTILLKDLFTEGIVNKEGNSISNKVIQSIISELVQAEDKKTPYTDRQLVSILANKGYSIARRTVAKYRELLNIPVAQIRGLWE